MVILKVTKNQDFALSLEDAFLKKTHGCRVWQLACVAYICTPNFIGVCMILNMCTFI